jgi:hypothetical protein
LNGIENGPVTRAATDVAVKALLDDICSRGAVLSKEGIHIDDETRRAKPALTGIVINDALLHGMQAVPCVAHALNSDYFVTIHST